MNHQLSILMNEIGGLISGKLKLEVSSPDEDLLTSGLIDSLALTQLLTALEEHFEIRIPLEELQIEDVRSIRSIACLVKDRRLQNAKDCDVGNPAGASTPA